MSLLIQYVMWYNLLIIPYFCKIDSMWLKITFYHSLRLKQTECICMYFTVERLQHLCKVLHIICSLWTLIFFLGIETFKIVESLHHYHDKSLRHDEFVRNSAKTNEKHYTIPDSKRVFFSNTVPITHFGRHLSVFIKTGWGWARYLLLSISMKKANSCHIQRLGI